MLIPLKIARDQPLQRQLYDQLRDLIVSSRLTAGTRMPSTRMLADQFSISRTTVLLTYERLIAEGRLESRPAAGTFVARRPKITARASVSPSQSQEFAYRGARRNRAAGRLSGSSAVSCWPSARRYPKRAGPAWRAACRRACRGTPKAARGDCRLVVCLAWARCRGGADRAG